MQSGDEEDENMSMGSSSDDSHESMKKFRKDTADKEDVSWKTSQKSQQKKNDCSTLPEGKQTTMKSDNESDGAMSCDLNNESQKSKGKSNKKKRNIDKTTDTKDVHEELEKMSCGRDEEEEEEDDAVPATSNMLGEINGVTKEDSVSLPSFSGNSVSSKTNHSNSSNICNSKPQNSNNGSSSMNDPSEEPSTHNPLVGGGPNKRRRNKSYRSRLQESSDEGVDQDLPGRRRPAESRSPSAGSRRASSSNQPRRPSAQRRRSGELRESSTAGSSRIRRPQRDGPQEPGKLAVGVGWSLMLMLPKNVIHYFQHLHNMLFCMAEVFSAFFNN